MLTLTVAWEVEFGGTGGLLVCIRLYLKPRPEIPSMAVATRRRGNKDVLIRSLSTRNGDRWFKTINTLVIASPFVVRPY